MGELLLTQDTQALCSWRRVGLCSTRCTATSPWSAGSCNLHSCTSDFFHALREIIKRTNVCWVFPPWCLSYDYLQLPQIYCAYRGIDPESNTNPHGLAEYNRWFKYTVLWSCHSPAQDHYKNDDLTFQAFHNLEKSFFFFCLVFLVTWCVSRDDNERVISHRQYIVTDKERH